MTVAPHQRFHLLVALSSIFLSLLHNVNGVFVEKFPYLYATPEDRNASFPVVEHFSPRDRGELGADDEEEEHEDRPDFLYNHENQPYRIVEFYIHWCNTCKLYAPIYHKFAEKVRALAGGIEIATHAVSCAPNRPLCVDQAVKGFPKIRLYKPGSGEYTELAHHAQIQPYTVLEALGIDFEAEETEDSSSDDWDVDTLLEEEATRALLQQFTLWDRLKAAITGNDLKQLSSQSNNYNINSKPYHRRTRDNLQADIHLSLDYALRHEIYTRHGELSEEQKRVLKDWLELLHATLPQSWELSKLLRELIDNFVYIVRSEDYLLAVLDEYPAAAERWSLSCSHGAADEGYTCGLWELFHAMSVGVVDYNRATLDADRILITENVAKTLRDYIDNFFGCESCRQHFVATFDACGHDRCDRLKKEWSEKEIDWVQMPLWLFETHNAVNVRLLKERAARENRDLSADNIAQVQWPPRWECSACWVSPDEWDDDTVYKYLRLEYGQRDAHSMELRREIMGQEESEQQNESGWETPSTTFVLSSSLTFAALIAVTFAAIYRRPRHVPVNVPATHPVPDIMEEIRAVANCGKILEQPDIMDEIRAVANYGATRKVHREKSSEELSPPDLLIEKSKSKKKQKVA